MKRLLVTLALFAATAGHALAQTREEQDNVINHIAEVMAIEKLCPKLERNTFILSMAATMYGLTAKDIGPGGRYHKKLVGLIQDKQLALSAHEEDIVCMTGIMLYGENGTNVEGLLVGR